MPFAEPRARSTKRSGNRDQASKQQGATRSRFFGEEEKRELILAHAANRQPIDQVQRVSLWAGVIICAAAIGVGWLYSVRNGMAEIFPTAQKAAQSVGQTKEEAAWQQYQYREQIHAGADDMLKQVEKIEKEQMGGGLNQFIQQSMEMASATNMFLASSTKATVNSDLFRAAVAPGQKVK